jgi:hypothetical protein
MPLIIYRRTRESMLVVGVLVLIALCAFLVLNGSSREGNMAVGAASGDDNPISSIVLNVKVSPPVVVSGNRVKISASVSVRGGPAPVTFSVKFPDSVGGTYEGGITTMVEHDGTYGFELPAMPMNMSPGSYNVTVKASSGRAVAVQNPLLTVQAPPPL